MQSSGKGDAVESFEILSAYEMARNSSSPQGAHHVALSWHSGCGHLGHAECSGEPRPPRGMLGRGTDELVPRVREGLRTWFGLGLELGLG